MTGGLAPESILDTYDEEHRPVALERIEYGVVTTAVMGRMTLGRFRHLPVAEGAKLTGIISIGDVVKARIEQVEREAEDMRAYIETA